MLLKKKELLDIYSGICVCVILHSPTPEVFWEKLDGTKVLPDRAKLKGFGMMLEINNAQESDAGQYECMGLNTETKQRATKAFTVRVECKLIFTILWANSADDTLMTFY